MAEAVVMFKPGQSGNPGGRPKGSVDKKWATLEYWFAMLVKDLEDPKLQVSERVKAQLKLIELILSKKSLPKDVEDSVASADATMKMLQEMEANAKRRSGNPPSLDNRPPTV